ncbi:MAG: hypothetical protein AB1507_05850 [Bacillota bacterium]|jgi:hypothetical protein
MTTRNQTKTRRQILLKKACRRLKRLFARGLLLPLLPLFWWGPVAHPYINYRALKQAEKEAAADNPRVNRDLLARVTRHRDSFIFGGNSADSIAARHILTRSAVYDYTHNFIPDSASGRPVFGYALISEWLVGQERGRRPYREEDLAVACGWLAHQLADWYAHYAAVDAAGTLLPEPCTPPDGSTVFSGYANSHRVFGADFCPEILREYRLMDHALVEFFHDFLISYDDREERFNTNRVVFFQNYRAKGRRYNLLTAASERFRGLAPRIPPDELDSLRENLQTIVKGLRILIHLASFLRPELAETVRQGISPAATGKPDYIELSAAAVFDGLFCRSYEEIALLAEPPRGAAPEIRPDPLVVREVTQPGTLLFRLAHRLGSLLPDTSLPLFREPEDFSIRFLKVFELRGKIVSRLIAGLSVEKLLAFSSTADENALLAFLSTLLTTPHLDLGAARAYFRAVLQPVVLLGGDPSASEAERLTAMLNAGELTVRVVPAFALNDPASRQLKALDLATLRLYVDGYDVRDDADRFELRLVPVDNSRLEARVKLKQRLSEGYHRLKVAVKDNCGVAADTFERDFWAGPAARLTG